MTEMPIKKADKSVWLNILRCMMLARLTEERLVRLYHQGKIFGGVYTGIGQEAIGAATTLACGEDDLFTPCIRDMSAHIGRGQTVLNIFRQYLGRATSPTRGRDANVHYGQMERGVYAMISFLGAMLPVLVGGVLARRRQGKNTIGIAYIGDGATSTGDFHEAVNFAAVMDVPVIFLIENNKYAYSTPTELQYRCKNLIDRAPGYGIDGFETDGNDAVSLYLLTRKIVDDIRKKPRAILLECDTLRMRGHGEHDNFSYVPRELLEEYAARDPIQQIWTKLVEAGLAGSDELNALKTKCQQEVDLSYHQALAEPPPNTASLIESVYAVS